MHTDTEFLKSIAADIVSRQDPDSIHESKADHRLVLEANRLERAITVALRAFENPTQRDTFLNDSLVKLVNICDLLFNEHHRISPDVQVLMDWLTAIKRVIPREISPLLQLPKAFIIIQNNLLKEEWKEYENTLRTQEINAELIRIAAIPFERFIKAKDKLYWGDYTWLKGYAAKLDAVNWENADCNSKTEALISLLIGRDFNHDQFFIYCKKYIKERIATIGTKKRRLIEYDICRRLVQEDAQHGLPPFDRHANPVSERLLNWLVEETKALTVSDAEEYISKLSVIWNLETLAVFFKLLWDHKVFRDVTLEIFSEQIAAAFSTKGKGDFKARSIHGRFYVRDRDVLLVLEALLLKMLADVRALLQ